MKIGIIGAGNIGATLVRHFTRLGHSVSVANSRGPETLKELSLETGAQAVTINEVVKGAELIVVTIPQKNIPDLPKDLFKSLDPKVIVIDTGNYYPNFRDPKISDIENGMVESEWVSREIDRPVVKVFNNIFAKSLAEKALPKGAPHRVALPIAGDDPRSKEIVSDLVDAIGFDPVDGGTLSQSWRQQPGSKVYCVDFDAEGVRDALVKADRQRSVEVRDLTISKMKTMKPGDSLQKITDFTLSLYA